MISELRQYVCEALNSLSAYFPARVQYPPRPIRVEDTEEFKAKQLRAKFEAACRAGDLESIEVIVQKESPWPWWGVALEIAAESGHEPIVHVALRQKPLSHYYLDSALYNACSRGYLEIARLLLGAGAHAGGTRPETTPILGASVHGYKEIVSLLLEYGADPSATGRGGNSALSLASANGHTDVVEVLLAANASIGNALVL